MTRSFRISRIPHITLPHVQVNHLFIVFVAKTTKQTKAINQKQIKYASKLHKHCVQRRTGVLGVYGINQITVCERYQN